MEKLITNCKCVILVMARDASLKQASILAILFRKYWKNCKYKLVLCTQNMKPNNNMYDEVIYTDNEMIWGDRLKVALEYIDSDYVILSPEDSFLKSEVNERKIEKIMQFMDVNNVGAIRLKPPMLQTIRYNSEYDMVPTKATYRLILHPMIYKTEYLRRYTHQHYSPWQFERAGSVQSRKYVEKIYCTRECVYDSIHAWSAGAWQREAFKLLKKEKIDKSLYEGDSIYPVYKTVKDRIMLCIIRLFPNIVTSIRIKQSMKSEKKLMS